MIPTASAVDSHELKGDMMRDPIILRHKHPLSPGMACYWKDQLYRVVKVGTELEIAPPKGVKRAAFEGAVRSALSPSGNFAHLGPLGVLDVTPEHCGIEVRIIGRPPYFRALQSQYRHILGILQQQGGRHKATCGLHFHLLSPGLAEPVPEGVLANLWNLTRRYGPELKFLTSTGDRRQALCRRRNPNSHLEMVQHSPVMTPMSAIQQALKASRTVPEHQNFLNLEHLRFTESGDVWPFHLEFRFPDADLCATAITAKTFLFLALLLKAVDLSQYGVIHVGKIDPWRRKVELLNLLSNNDGSLASSDTSGVTDDMLEELRQGTYELLDLLTPSFNHFADSPALDVLMALAETPISLRRCAGQGWGQIETELSDRARGEDYHFDSIDRDLMQHIELGDWCQFASLESWCWYAARELFVTPQSLETRLHQLQGLRGVRWDGRQGALVFER